MKEENMILTFSDVTIRYRGRPRPAVEGVSLSVPRDGITMIVGESGSGKSTLLRSSIGLLPEGGQVNSGQILFEGQDVCQMSPRALRSIRGEQAAMIFQDAGLYLDSRWKIGAQYVETIRCHQKMTKKEALDAAAEMLGELGLPEPLHLLDSYPFELSGGMKQRVAIAMAMTLRPKLLLCDEPTSALDVTIQAQVVRLMQQLHRQYGTAILMVTHNIGLAAYMGDQIAVMRQGKLVEWGTRDEILLSPQDAYTRQLLQAAPKLEV